MIKEQGIISHWIYWNEFHFIHQYAIISLDYDGEHTSWGQGINCHLINWNEFHFKYQYTIYILDYDGVLGTIEGIGRDFKEIKRTFINISLFNQDYLLNWAWSKPLIDQQVVFNEVGITWAIDINSFIYFS